MKNKGIRGEGTGAAMRQPTLYFLFINLFIHPRLLLAVAFVLLMVSCGEEEGVYPYRPDFPTNNNRRESNDAQFLLNLECFSPSQKVAMVSMEDVHYWYKDNSRFAFSFDTAGRCLDIFGREDGTFEHIHYEYDSLGRRILDVRYSDTVALADESRLMPISRTTYTYKRNGRICKAVIQGQEGKCYRFRLRYGATSKDGSRLLTDYIFPDGSRISYRYDSEGRLVRETLPDGTYKKYTYDSEGRLSSSATPNENGIFNFEQTTWYHDASTVLERDDQGRILQRQNGKVIETYHYDENGNWVVCDVTRDGALYSRITRYFTYYSEL